jgi:sarcosine oxidase subunit alpha
LHAQSGGRPRWDDARACFVPVTSVQAERSVGACNGSFSLRACLTEGQTEGAAAAAAAGFGGGGPAADPPVTEEAPEQPLLPMWLIPSRRPVTRERKQFVDLPEDVTAADLEISVREGYTSIEHVKRYTTAGMGLDQGRLSGVNTLGIVAQFREEPIPAVGTTRFRPVYTPLSLGAVAGRNVGELSDPIRKTPLYEWHQEAGARFENVGQWRRAWYYPQAGESLRAAVNRECLATRTSVGILDYSTLGKIDIRGPDAAELLTRVYTNDWRRLRIGRCRYGLMLGEDGMVMDDGVTVRLGEQHYLMFTSTGGAATVLAWLERWLQTEWTELRVYLTSVSDQWADIALAGPHSRAVLTAVCADIDLSHAAFPFMTLREGTVAGVPARVLRISFSGELSYEINVPSDCARTVWEALMRAGLPFGITPYGTETMHVLRAEKGFIIVGQDTDGSVTPDDVGLAWMLSGRKDFLGKRSLARPDAVRPGRKQLVGLLTPDPSEVLPEGGQIVNDPSVRTPLRTIGHVTSSYYSASLGHSIALAMLERGRSRSGQRVYVTHVDERVRSAVVTSPVFYDPEGARQNV